MEIDPESTQDIYQQLLGWDVDLSIHENRLGTIQAPLLAAPSRAFVFNLRNIDNLMLSPFRIAADGVHQFYWTLKYIGAGNERIISVLRGEMPPAAIQADRRTKINEANASMGEFFANSASLDEFAQQIDQRLRTLVGSRDFQAAMRVQLLSSLVLLWTTYETLRNDLHAIGKIYHVGADKLDVSQPNADKLTRLKEYRNVIVHKAAIVDDRFVMRVGLQNAAEDLLVDSKSASHFFDTVAKVGVDMLLGLDGQIQSNPAPN